jgi:hypothetical protein
MAARDEPQEPIESPSGQTAHEPGRGDGYHTSKWKSFPMYVCDTCEFSTLSKTKIVDHVENAAENNERLRPSG